MKGRKAGAIALSAGSDNGIDLIAAAAGVCALIAVIIAVVVAF